VGVNVEYEWRGVDLDPGKGIWQLSGCGERMKSRGVGSFDAFVMRHEILSWGKERVPPMVGKKRYN